MDELDIRIELDPVKDGIVRFPVNFNKYLCGEVIARKALIVGTDLSFRTIGTGEMDSIFEEIGENGLCEPIGKNYLLCFSEKGVINDGYIRYLVGSAVMIKIGYDSRIVPLSDIDIKKMRTLFAMGTVTLSYGAKRFGAYLLEYENVA